jgi:hypothetical protein
MGDKAKEWLNQHTLARQKNIQKNMYESYTFIRTLMPDTAVPAWPVAGLYKGAANMRPAGN